MTKLVIVGGGGHGKVVLDLALAHPGYEPAAVADDKFSSPFIEEGIAYGPVEWVAKYLLEHPDTEAVIAIGDNMTRRSVSDMLQLPEKRYAVLIHPHAVIGSRVIIGPGSVVLPGAIINYGTKIGNHCIVNTGAIIEHDSIVHSYVHISPAAALAGSAIVEEGVHMGIGSKLIQGIKIGTWSTVGAGAVVVREIPSHCTAVGVPAKPIKFHR